MGARADMAGKQKNVLGRVFCRLATPSGNRTRVSPVAGAYSTTRPTVSEAVSPPYVRCTTVTSIGIYSSDQPFFSSQDLDAHAMLSHLKVPYRAASQGICLPAPLLSLVYWIKARFNHCQLTIQTESDDDSDLLVHSDLPVAGAVLSPGP